MFKVSGEQRKYPTRSHAPELFCYLLHEDALGDNERVDADDIWIRERVEETRAQIVQYVVRRALQSPLRRKNATPIPREAPAPSQSTSLAGARPRSSSAP